MRDERPDTGKETLRKDTYNRRIIYSYTRMSSSTSGSRLSSIKTEHSHIFMILVSRRPHVAVGTVASRVFATKVL